MYARVGLYAGVRVWAAYGRRDSRASSTCDVPVTSDCMHALAPDSRTASVCSHLLRRSGDSFVPLPR